MTLLKLIMETRGIQQRELSRLTGISRLQCLRLVNGTYKRPNPLYGREKAMISMILGTDSDTLFDENGLPRRITSVEKTADGFLFRTCGGGRQ